MPSSSVPESSVTRSAGKGIAWGMNLILQQLGHLHDFAATFFTDHSGPPRREAPEIVAAAGLCRRISADRASEIRQQSRLPILRRLRHIDGFLAFIPAPLFAARERDLVTLHMNRSIRTLQSPVAVPRRLPA